MWAYFPNTYRCYNVYLREADEKVQTGQRESDRRLGERIADITFWRNELTSELERLLVENGKMQECRRRLQIAIQNLERPLHIAQECLYHRESRKGSSFSDIRSWEIQWRIEIENKQSKEYSEIEESCRTTSINQSILIGIDLVHDEVEKALLEEVETVKNCEKKLKKFMDRCINQVRVLYARLR